MPKREGNASGALVRAHASLERFDDGRPGAPRHVKARHAIARRARAGGATLGPSDGREPAHAERVKP